MDYKKTINIIDFLLTNLTDVIFIRDVSTFLLTSKIPKIYYCIIEESENSENEINAIKNMVKDFEIVKDCEYLVKFNLYDKEIVIELSNKSLSDILAKYIFNKSNKIFKDMGINVCSCRGCKNKTMGKNSPFCINHYYINNN